MIRAAAVVLALAVGVAGASPPRARWQTLPLPPAMPKAVETGTVAVGDAKIYYAMYGKGDPVILLHGGLGNSDHFALQVPALAQKYRVIAIDSRAQGRSTRGKAVMTYDQMAADVVAVMDQLKLTRASVVGWSDGGEVALKLGIAFPERVSKLFVFGANYDANGSKPRGNRTATFAAYSAKCRADYEKLAGAGTYDGLVEALLPLWRAPTGITKDQLRHIKAPVMMADGDHDEVIVLEQIQEMSQLIPGAKLMVLADTSHFALWQDPADFNRAVLDFLAPAT